MEVVFRSDEQATPEMSVILMLRNEEPTLPVSLESLARQQTSFDFEVIWVDGVSTDRSVDVIREHALSRQRPTTIVVQSPDDAGMAVAQQIGAELARGEIFVFMQADVRVLDPHALEKIRRAFDDAQVVGTTFIGRGPDRAFDEYDFWGQVFMARYLGDRVEADFDLKLNGVRREAFFDIGGFDVERLPLGGNDFDFSVRLGEAGRIVHPEVEAEHLHGLGKRHSAAGLLRKYCRNSEVAGVTAALYFRYRRQVPGYWRFAAQQFGLVAACALSLVPLLWPWMPLLVLAMALYWQRAALTRVRSWRLPSVLPFAVAGVYAFAFYFTSGLLVGRTRYDFDNKMH